MSVFEPEFIASHFRFYLAAICVGAAHIESGDGVLAAQLSHQKESAVCPN